MSSAYRQPVIPGFNPDPSMIRVGKDYFLVTSSFEYFPGIPIYTSQDLINWRLLGHALTRRSQLDLRTCEAGGGIFAPTIREHKGRIYVTSCQMHKMDMVSGFEKTVVPRGFFVYTDDIWTPNSFSDPIFLENAGIDQDLFFDDLTGKVWMSTADFITDPAILSKKTGHPIVVVTREIDINTGKNLTQDKVICYTSVGNGVAEGPHIFIKDGYYYLNVAIGGTEIQHQQWIYRSKEGPLGPWETAGPDINPMLFNNDHPEVRLTGHMDLCEGMDSKWWACFLGVRPQLSEDGKLVNSQLGRESFLCPVEWKDGWPVVNQKQPVTINGLESCGLERLPETFEERYDYQGGSELPLGWYHQRTPVKPDFDLNLRPGSIALYGNCYRFKDDECIAMHLRKQTAFEGEWNVTIDFRPDNVGEEAGTTVYWSKHCFASLGIRGGGITEGPASKLELVFRYPDPTLPEKDNFPETVLPITNHEIDVKIIAKSQSYEFLVAKDEKWKSIGSINPNVLTRTRIFDAFCTGTMLGIYASGSTNRPSLSPAYFSDISWKGVRGGGL